MAQLNFWILVGVLFLAMLACLEIGRQVGLRRIRTDPEHAHDGVNALDAAVYSLLGLLLAFSFSDAQNRLDDRRRQIVEEVNGIGTAWLRVDLLPADAQPAVRDAFRSYVDARIETYEMLRDSPTAVEPMQRASALQNEIWKLSVAASDTAPEGTSARILLLPALNAMIDITTTRLSMTLMHPPPIVISMLVLLALASAMLAGISMAASKERRWVHLLGFAGTIAAVMYLIADIEFPRRGLVRIDAFDQLMRDLRQQMG